jgi:flavin reductase (DIM6/NTAB) family NADH-FMN oxidoreductase RutF
MTGIRKAAHTFSLSFFDESFRGALTYLGSKSGREEDKIANSKLATLQSDGTPYFAEAKLVVLCKKLFAQEYKPENFIDPEIIPKWYPQNDHHTLYIAEVTKILTKE